MKLIDRLFFQKSDNFLIQFVRYGFVGGLAFLVDFGTLYILTEIFSIHYLISAALAFFLGLITNYILSVVWVFKYRSLQDRRLEFLIFAVIGLIGLGLNELIIWFFTEKVHFYYLYSKLVSTGLVYFWNFLMRRYLLYSKR